MKNSIKILKDHNAWRRGDDSEQASPDVIGVAIDDCIQAAKRYELVRILHPQKFMEVYKRNMNGELFDDIIDELIKEREA